MAKKKPTHGARSQGSPKAKKSGIASAKKSTKKLTGKSTSKSNVKKTTTKKTDPRQRLQRVMAAAGVGSRRECELIIEEGRVEVDGEIVVTLGLKVDPAKQEIYVDAQKISVQRLQYFILNKPPGIVSTSKDPSGRPRVIDLIDTDKRVYNVGRLDQSSEGLILVTNDGELANRLTHPRYGVEKKYHVQVSGTPATADLRKLEQGVYIAEGLARATKAKFLKKANNGCWLEIVLAEGRNREIRRMLAIIGHKVRTLKRVSIGPLKLGDLPRGAHRALLPAEVKALRLASSEAKPKRRKPTRKEAAEVTPRKPVEMKRESKPNEVAEEDSTKPARPSRRMSDQSRPAGKKKKARRSSAAGARGAARNQPPKRGKASKPASRKSKAKKRR